MFAQASNSKNKLQQNSSWKMFLIWCKRNFFCHRKDLPEEKHIIENTWKHDLFQDIIANRILEILAFSKSVKFLNSLLKSRKFIKIKQYAHIC